MESKLIFMDNNSALRRALSHLYGSYKVDWQGRVYKWFTEKAKNKKAILMDGLFKILYKPTKLQLRVEPKRKTYLLFLF